ncbi:hypothetical protein M595_1712 [Lyngbya aestuarii BL J]|uniref:Uncharacterized protein n=1 Tax=Lyngbya aestuarii BL J TaxID=1348334 RepID=U7QJW1_9CYAN|nr:hypothetical protein [Lyngbya aestuarii]ERT08254.1 hypothetical protein M595_1712 [Lyngbya aestuarii BL J]
MLSLGKDKLLSRQTVRLISGHDLIEILSIGLCQFLGSNNSKDVEAEQIEKILRLAYESSYFRKTQLYSLIQQWESLNTPFVILHQEE